MAWFHFGKKKEVPGKEEVPSAAQPIHSIRVLGAGPGCVACHIQLENAREAVANLGLSIEVEYITDVEKIMAYGIMSVPALVINDKVVNVGKALKTAEIEKLLKP